MTGSCKILLTDDEPEFRDTLKDVLETVGYEVSLADDGLSAVSMVAVNRYDAVIMDVRMPRMDGITALGRILEIKPEMNVFLVTAFRLTGEENRQVREKARAVYSKSLNLEKFLGELKKALGS